MKKLLAGIGLLAVPVAASAQGLIKGVNNIGDIISTLIPIAIALAILFFFWGLAKYILNQGDEEKKKEGRGIMIWGVIAIFIMVSIWGLVSVVGETLGIEIDETGFIPQINVPSDIIQ